MPPEGGGLFIVDVDGDDALRGGVEAQGACDP